MGEMKMVRKSTNKHVENRMGWRTWLMLLLLSVARRATAPAYTMDLALGRDEAAARTRLALVLRHIRHKRKSGWRYPLVPG